MSVSLNSKDPELFSESFQTLIWLAVVFPKTDGIDIKFTDSNSQDTVEYILLRENSIIGKRQ